jgi:hypothetical protein
MKWRPLSPRDYALGLLGGLALGVLVAGIAIWAASVTA